MPAKSKPVQPALPATSARAGARDDGSTARRDLDKVFDWMVECICREKPSETDASIVLDLVDKNADAYGHLFDDASFVCEELAEGRWSSRHQDKFAKAFAGAIEWRSDFDCFCIMQDFSALEGVVSIFMVSCISLEQEVAAKAGMPPIVMLKADYRAQ